MYPNSNTLYCLYEDYSLVERGFKEMFHIGDGGVTNESVKIPVMHLKYKMLQN